MSWKKLMNEEDKGDDHFFKTEISATMHGRSWQTLHAWDFFTHAHVGKHPKIAKGHAHHVS